MSSESALARALAAVAGARACLLLAADGRLLATATSGAGAPPPLPPPPPAAGVDLPPPPPPPPPAAATAARERAELVAAVVAQAFTQYAQAAASGALESTELRFVVLDMDEGRIAAAAVDARHLVALEAPQPSDAAGDDGSGLRATRAAVAALVLELRPLLAAAR